MPYNITVDGPEGSQKRKYIAGATKENITAWDLIKADAEAGAKAALKADGWSVGATNPESNIYFTFYHTFFIPLNTINQIFDTSNMFYMCLLN